MVVKVTSPSAAKRCGPFPVRIPLSELSSPPLEAAAVTGDEPPASPLVSCQPTRPFLASGHVVLHQQNSSRKETRSESVGQ